MLQITIEVSNEFAQDLAPIRDWLPEVLARALQEQHPTVNETYRYVLQFLAGSPSPQAIIDFKPTPAIQERISELLEKNREGQLTPAEAAELDEYSQINSSLSLLKARAFKELKASPA
jgi:hypothetical protein